MQPRTAKYHAVRSRFQSNSYLIQVFLLSPKYTLGILMGNVDIYSLLYVSLTPMCALFPFKTVKQV